MHDTISKHQRNMAGLIHLSTFSKYFFPFGNFIFPLLLWVTNKDKLSFVDAHGKQAINFQISMLLYGIVLGILAIPLVLMTGWELIGFTNLLQYNNHNFEFNLSHLPHLGRNAIILGVLSILGIGLLLTDIVCTIIATLRATESQLYRYPLSISFLK